MKTWLTHMGLTALTAALAVSAMAASPSISDSKIIISEPHALPASPLFPAGHVYTRSDITPDAPAAISPYFVAEAPATAYGWSMILSKYVAAPDETGLARFDYGALHANADDRAALKTYIQELETEDPAAMSGPAAIAYWANLYNAVTIDVVIDNYPVKSIRDIKSGWRAGPWKRDLVSVGGRKLSLDDIEHDILREDFPSPLIHYMVNCASVGCPNLKADPWSAKTLDADREAAARSFINSPRGVRMTDKGLKVSSIYKWFKKDFGGSKDGVLAHIREYADADLAAAIDGGAQIVDYGYSWSLNGAK